MWTSNTYDCKKSTAVWKKGRIQIETGRKRKKNNKEKNYKIKVIHTVIHIVDNLLLTECICRG